MCVKFIKKQIEYISSMKNVFKSFFTDDFQTLIYCILILYTYEENDDIIKLC